MKPVISFQYLGRRHMNLLEVAFSHMGLLFEGSFPEENYSRKNEKERRQRNLKWKEIYCILSIQKSWMEHILVRMKERKGAPFASRDLLWRPLKLVGWLILWGIEHSAELPGRGKFQMCSYKIETSWYMRTDRELKRGETGRPHTHTHTNTRTNYMECCQHSSAVTVV